MTTYKVTFALSLAALSIAVAACSGSDTSTSCNPADPACARASGDGGSTQDAAAQGDAAPGADASTSHDGGGGPGEGGGPHDSGTSLPPEGGVGGFAEVCDPNANMCPQAYPTCFTFTAKGPHCTKSCTTNADCPAQSPGCSGMGVCRIP